MAATRAHQAAAASETSSDTESVATQRAYEDGDDSDYECRPEKVGRRLLGQIPAHTHKHNSVAVTRQPTRRPDPNVSNRNALMARENRKRKKEQMEQLEHENGNLHRDLKKLQKVVDRQEVMIRGLRNERNYLKSVLENQSDIVTLLKRLQPEQEKEPIQMTQVEPGASPNSIYSDSGMSLCGDNSPFHDDDHNNNNNYGDNQTSAHFDSSSVFNNHGTEEEDFNLFFNDDAAAASLLNEDFPLISTDLLFSADPFALADGDFDLAEEEEEENSSSTTSTTGTAVVVPQEESIRSEHNYVYPDVSLIPHDNHNAVVVVKNPTVEVMDGEDDGDDEYQYVTGLSAAKRPRLSGNCEGTEFVATQKPGICLHIGGGKVSIEFCAQCHESANRQWHVKRL